MPAGSGRQLVWATRRFGIAGWFDIRERFRYQHILMDMLLVATKGSATKTRLYVGVLGRRLLEPYEGFHEIPEAAIPKQVTVLARDASKFRESFNWPRR